MTRSLAFKTNVHVHNPARHTWQNPLHYTIYYYFFFTVNLTPHGQVVQRTTHAEYSAHLAIKGPATNKRADGCYISAIGQTYAWCCLQLPAVAYMTNIVIYSLEECKLYYNCMKR